MKNNSISGSVSLTHRVLCGVIFLCALTVFTAMAASDERGIEYKQFRPEMVSCDAAILYKTNTAGLDIAISVIAYGKSPESGNWRVTDISLSRDSVRIGPDAGGKVLCSRRPAL